MSCDWLRPVTRGTWRAAPPISIAPHTLTRLQYLLGASVDRSISYRFAVDLDARASFSCVALCLSCVSACRVLVRLLESS